MSIISAEIMKIIDKRETQKTATTTTTTTKQRKKKTRATEAIVKG